MGQCPSRRPFCVFRLLQGPGQTVSSLTVNRFFFFFFSSGPVSVRRVKKQFGFGFSSDKSTGSVPVFGSGAVPVGPPGQNTS